MLGRPLVVAAFAVACCALLLAGCGGSSKPVAVRGKIALPPKMSLKDDDSVQLSFIPDGAGKSVVASVNPKDLTFSADVVPGKYKIAVALKAYAGQKGSEARDDAFKPTNKLFAPGTTKLTYEVTNDPTQSIKIDLAAGSVTK